MKKITFLFAFFLSLFGGTQAWAVIDNGDGTVTEGFDGSSKTYSGGYILTLPSDWYYSGDAATWSVETSSDGIFKTKPSLYTYSTTNTSNYLITPELEGDFSFWMRSYNKSYASSIVAYECTYEGGVFTLGDKIGEITIAKANPVAAIAKKTISYDKSGRVAILMNYAYFDDFTYKPYVDASAITKPSGFTCTATTYNSATFSWTAGGEETAWQIVYSTDAGFDKNAAEPVNITVNPFTLTGLSENTTYYAYLRAKKGEDVSSWTSKISFTTPEQYPRPTAFTFTSYTGTTATFGWTAGSDETSWQIAYSTDADFDPATAGTKVAVTTNPYTLEGLTAETTYYAYIRANYGTGYSVWTDKVTFKPTNAMDLLVNDGTSTNSYVPIYGLYTDDLTRSQMIIPATSLTSMQNRQITKLTFFTQESSLSWGAAQFEVYMGEIDKTSFTSTTAEDWGTLTKVFNSATLSVSGNKMVVEFDEPYDYSDGNLIIGFNQTVKGSYKTSTWYGITGTNTAISGYGTNSNSYRGFLPKMTITSVPQSATPKAKMVVSTDALAFGKITPETTTEGKAQTFTISNTGKADLTNINITSNNVAYTIDSYSSSIAFEGAPITVTVRMDTEKAVAGDNNATITITADDQTDATIDVTGIFANAPATMSITPSVDATVAFGIVNKQAVKTFTVANTGDLTLHVTSIESSNTTDFTVSPASLDIAGGETGEFTVTFVYDEGALDAEKTANITLKATGLSDKVFAVTGTRSDIWSEDFEASTEIPDGWTSTGFVVKTGTVGSYPTYTLTSNWAVGNGGSSNKTLVTPLLQATAGDKLTFDGFFYYGDETMKVEYSTDLMDWHSDAPLYNYDKSLSYENGSTHNVEISAPITGKFYLRFTVNYYNGIDNIVGFKLAKADTHAASVMTTTIPTTGNQYVEYTASVDVKVTGTNDEELTVKFFIGGKQYGDAVVKTVNANAIETFEVTFTPDAAVSGDAYFTIESADIAAFESGKTAVTIAAATVLDETVGLPDGLVTGTKASVVLKYTANNGWNTIAVPFVLTDEILTSIFGAGYKVFELNSFADNTIDFKAPTYFAAGYPYLVYVETAATHAEGVKLFDLNISTTTENYDTKNDVNFKTTYAGIAAGALTDWYGVTSAGEVRKAGSSAWINGFRGYFTGAISPSTGARISVDGDGIVTGINSIDAKNNVEGVYNLNGQKVERLQKGLYIVNGCKVVKK